MPSWQRLAIVLAVLVLTAIVARLIDRRMAKRELAPEVATRYRVLRRSVTVAVFFVGILSALLVIPQVRAVAGGLLASSAVVGIVIGFASQRTIGNFVAGLLIAFTQPIRLGDRVEIDDLAGNVEEIGLTYTFIRTDEGSGWSSRTRSWPRIRSSTRRSSVARRLPKSLFRFLSTRISGRSSACCARASRTSARLTSS